MSTAGQTLRELHRLHRHIRDLKSEIEKGPRLIKQQQTKLTKHETTVRETQDKLKHLKVSQHAKETTLKGTHQQIAKYEKQLETAGSKKEYDALQSEITHAKENCAALEDEILATMGEIDDCTAQIPVVEKELADLKTETIAYENDAQDRFNRLTNDLQETQKLLSEMEANLPDSIKTVYAKLISARGADGIAVVQDKTCMGCYAAVTQQQFRELEGGMLGTCKTCARLIYV
jgi:predicted  nucleic acid-binding Zn-ribbon protein